MKNIIHHKSSVIDTADRAIFLAENMSLIQPMHVNLFLCDEIRQIMFKHITEKMDPKIILVFFYDHNDLVV